MTGSKRWFLYTTDGGEDFAIQADESNTELVNPIGASGAVIPAGTLPLPKGVNARYVSLEDPTGSIRRIAYILTPTTYNTLTVNSPFTLTADGNFGVGADVPVLVKLKQPEIARRQPFQGDTALIDGDNP